MNDKIIIKGAREHNLKNISLELPRNKLITITGLSGSGKSSLAFDTIFAEGQRRYVESLSAYARQFLGQMEKPDVDEIEGLSPAISIDQKAHSANPRSTVATITEIYDYLRVLFARVGRPHCVKCRKEIQKLTNEEMVDVVVKGVAGTTKAVADDGIIGKKKASVFHVLAPVVLGRKGEYYQLLYDLYNAGFAKVRIDGKMFNLSEQIKLKKYQQHTIEVVVDSIPTGELASKEGRQRLAEALQTAVERGNDVALVLFPDGTEQSLSSKFSCPDDGFSFPEIEPRLFSFNSPYGACELCHGLGVKEIFSEEICVACEGRRLRKEALFVWMPTVIARSPQTTKQSQREIASASGPRNDNAGISIVDITNMSIETAVDYFLSLSFSDRDKEIAGPVLKEVMNRLQFMLDVGLHSACVAGRVASRRRAVRPRRADDWAPPAGQRPADRNARAAPRPRQHRPRGRARRGHHSRVRLHGGDRPGRRRARRERGGDRTNTGRVQG